MNNLNRLLRYTEGRDGAINQFGFWKGRYTIDDSLSVIDAAEMPPNRKRMGFLHSAVVSLDARNVFSCQSITFQPHISIKSKVPVR